MRVSTQAIDALVQRGGLLVLTVVKAELTRDTETIGKMDPYVIVKIG